MVFQRILLAIVVHVWCLVCSLWVFGFDRCLSLGAHVLLVEISGASWMQLQVSGTGIAALAHSERRLAPATQSLR